jgi:hypothetical protein
MSYVNQWHFLKKFKDYMISDCGQIKNIKTNTICKERFNGRFSYVRIKGFQVNIDEILWETFQIKRIFRNNSQELGSKQIKKIIGGCCKK